MKKLIRPESPSVKFQNYISRGNNWDLLHKTSDKAVIKLSLLNMSNNRCAYCEHEIEDLTSHIEHLARRSSHPQKTFEWDNLFCSCDFNDSCGSYKDDVEKYTGDSSDLIKPDRDDPNDYLQINSQDGSFYGIEDNTKALNTIKTFNLNCPRLKIFRLSLINITKQIMIDFEEFIDEVSDDDLSEIYEEIINITLQNYKEINVDELGFIQMHLKNFQHLFQLSPLIYQDTFCG